MSECSDDDGGSNANNQNNANTSPGDCGWAIVQATAEHTCGMRNDGSVWCWGSNHDGKLGHNGVHNLSYSTPQHVQLPFPAVSVATGENSP